MANGADPILGIVVLALLAVCGILAACLVYLVRQNLELSRTVALFRLATTTDHDRVAIVAAKKLADSWPRPPQKPVPVPARDPEPKPEGLKFTTNL